MEINWKLNKKNKQKRNKRKNKKKTKSKGKLFTEIFEINRPVTTKVKFTKNVRNIMINKIRV